MWNARNFYFLQNIVPDARKGRFWVEDEIPHGSPVVLKEDGGPNNDGKDGFGRTVVRLAEAGDDPSALAGLVAWDGFAFEGQRGVDPETTTVSDIRMIQAGSPVQVVHGLTCRFRLQNTEDQEFGAGLKTIAGITMVADLAQATPDAALGAFLVPVASPSDANGYWEVTTTRADAWAEITNFDVDLQQIDAQLLF